MQSQNQEQTIDKNQQSLSSDQEFPEQQNPSSSNHNRQQLTANQAEDVMDQKQEIRQHSQEETNNEEQTMEEIIKQENLEGEVIKYEELEIEADISTNLNQTILEKQISSENTDGHIKEDKSQKEKVDQRNQNSLNNLPNQKSSSIKTMFKNFSSLASTKYLQPNSPELFIGPHSLLPNEIICIENNSTRVIVHMNKKIVPIPSSFQTEGKTKTQSPQKSRTTLPSVQCPYLLGKLIVTNYKLAYLDSLYPNTMTFCLPLNYIQKVQRTSEQSTGISYVELWFKTGLSVKIKYHQQEFNFSLKIKEVILNLIQKNLYAAVDYGSNQGNETILCKSFVDKFFDEEKTCKMIKGIDAQIVDNSNWEDMSGYPEKYVVPLRFIGKRNTDTRVVVFSYLYSIQNQKISLWRTGPGNIDPYEQEWISKAKFSNNHYVIEIKNKGIGISKSQANRLIEIQSLYLLRESYYKVHQLTYHNHESMKWLGSMCGTRWYEQVATVMNEALHIIEVMSSKVNVTLVCDAESRGAQVSALLQLLMNPYYRTFEGFPCLIEKQFLQFGCPKVSKKQRQEDKSIILIQFLDCVYQFTHLYPLSFEFNEHYLVFLAQNVFSNKYGNFLYVTRQLKKESQRREVVEKCVDIWEDIRRKIETDKRMFLETDQINKPLSKKSTKKSVTSLPVHQLVNYYIFFRNSFYIDHNESNIFELRNHSEISKGIKLWSSYFCKKIYCSENLKEQVLFCSQIEKRYFKIAFEHNLTKKYNEKMRKKLSEQYSKIAEKRKQLKTLKQL